MISEGLCPLLAQKPHIVSFPLDKLVRMNPFNRKQTQRRGGICQRSLRASVLELDPVLSSQVFLSSMGSQGFGGDQTPMAK